MLKPQHWFSSAAARSATATLRAQTRAKAQHGAKTTATDSDLLTLPTLPPSHLGSQFPPRIATVAELDPQ